MRTQWLAVVTMAVLATAFVSTSHAATPPDEARARASRSFSEAKKAFALRSYTAAATAFEEAARLVPHPATWLNAAEAWELAGEPARAAENCDRVMAMESDDAHGADAARRLERLLPKVVTVDLRGSPPLSARLDEGEPLALPARRRLAPGHHVLVIVDLATSAEHRMELDLEAGSSKAIDLGEASKRPAPDRISTPIPNEEGPHVAQSSDTRRTFDRSPPIASWLAFGAAGAFAGITTAFGLATLDAQNEFEKAPSQDALDRFHGQRLITNVALAASFLSATAGVAIWIWSPRSSPSMRVELAGPSVQTRISF